MAAGQASATGPTVTLVQLPNGQTVQVHGVIQAAQPSVIQSPQVQAVQVSSPSWLMGLISSHRLTDDPPCPSVFQISTIAESEDSQESVDSVTDTQKRREILSRRPSYRSVHTGVSSTLIASTLSCLCSLLAQFNSDSLLSDTEKS